MGTEPVGLFIRVTKDYCLFFISLNIQSKVSHNLGIEAFIDFKKNHVVERSKSFLRKRQLLLYRNEKDIWHESCRFRVLIESLFSVIKRKGKSYLRSRNPTAQDCEMLLKIFWYNLNIIAKHYH